MPKTLIVSDKEGETFSDTVDTFWSGEPKNSKYSKIEMCDSFTMSFLHYVYPSFYC